MSDEMKMFTDYYWSIPRVCPRSEASEGYVFTITSNHRQTGVNGL